MPDVYQQRTVEARPEEVVRVIREPQEWLEKAARKAGHFGHAVDVRLRSEFGLRRMKAGIAKRARLEVGKAQLARDHFVVPITWEAAGYVGLFPVMDGLIEIHRAGRNTSRVVFWGRYDPPLGRAGQLIDRYVAHQVAEATVDHLLDELAQHVETAAERPSEGVAL